MKALLAGIIVLIGFTTAISASALPIAGVVPAVTSYCGEASRGLTILLDDPEWTFNRSVATSRLVDHAGWKGDIDDVGAPGAQENAWLVALTTSRDHPVLVVPVPPDPTTEWARSVVGPCA